MFNIKSLQIRTTLKFYLFTFRMAIIKKKKKQTIANAGKDEGEREPSQPLQKSAWRFIK
jgi:hypothetical protein